MFDMNVLNDFMLIRFLISLMPFVTGVDLFLILSLLLYCCTAPPHPAVPLAGRKQAVSTGSLLPGQRPRQHFMYVHCVKSKVKQIF